MAIRLKLKVALEAGAQAYTAEHGLRLEADAEVKLLNAKKQRSTIGFALGITGTAIVSAALAALVVFFVK